MNAIRPMRQARVVIVMAACVLWTATLSPARAAVCTLADHIRAANTNTAVGACPAGTSHDVITITEDITLTEALPVIRGTITIEGGGHTTSGDKKFPVFVVMGGWLTINNLTLEDGFGAGSWDTARTAAGGIQISESAIVTVNDSIFSGNRSGGGTGGAIAVADSALTVNNSSFLENVSTWDGGAIYVRSSAVVIKDSAFIRNSAGHSGHGGGVYIGRQSRVDISNSSFHDNEARDGGGVGTDVMPGEVTHTTLTHVTMVGNFAGQGQSVFADEDDSNFRLRNSILVGIGHRNCHGRLSQDAGNLIHGGACAPKVTADPRVGALVGLPAYYPLLDGSPALDAADPRFCTATDQIGTPRPQGAGCDIGAIEMRTTAAAETDSEACDLHDQIIAANTDESYNACPAGAGADTIHMVRDYQLDRPLPSIVSEITIEGNGYTISGKSKLPIFDVDGGKLTISSVTLAEGRASRGGAIRLRNGASVIASNVLFAENEAIRGGAIATESADDSLAVIGSSFINNNAAEKDGGAIMVEGGLAEVSGSAFQDNFALEYGGAVAAKVGQLVMTNTTLSGNRAKKGGGVYVRGGEATLTHLTLLNNRAERVIGAGIYREAGAVHLRNSVIGGSGRGDDCYGGLDQNRGNISQDGSCSIPEGGDLLIGDLVGSPAYHPLADGSPAHGKADQTFCLETDQVGNPRLHCDIGAIESARDPSYVAEPKAELPADCTLADQIIAANTDAPAGSCPAGEGADMIVFRRNVVLGEALPAITSDITISGNEHTISGNNKTNIFEIHAGAVIIKNLNLINGSRREGGGGAILMRNNADLTVVNSSFRNNRAENGGAIASLDRSRLQVYDSVFVENAAALRGGAIWNWGACGSIDDNQFRRNEAGAPSRKLHGDYVEPILHLDGLLATCSPGSGANEFSN